MSSRIHPTSVVDPRAELAEGVVVEPYAVVGPGVRIGAGTRLDAHAVVLGPLALGEGNVVHSFAVLGGEPQHKRAGATTPTTNARLVIGDRNVFREHVTVHRGTGEGRTEIGHDNLFMVGAHVAHDVTVGSSCTLANAVQLAGHAMVKDHATFGGLSGIAQFVVVGESAFVAAGAMCESDVPPFVIVQGDRARVRALNVVGLRRRGVPEASLERLGVAFQLLFGRKMPRADALAVIERGDPFVDALLAALSPPPTSRSHEPA
jgi:UDP-N-acetylglucosamine acyltransferase